MLARAFHRDKHDVLVLGRSPRALPWNTATWNIQDPTGWAPLLDGADVVINLAGRSVNCRYNATNRAEIISSRVDSVRAIENAIRMAKRPPRVWLQASTATIYAHSFDHEN